MLEPISSLVIVGGGTAGWMTAAFFAKRFADTPLKITLVESPDTGTIGVGEATVPAMKLFLNDLGINEREFIQATKATFKLGIDFDGWHKPGAAFFHPFAPFGVSIAKVPFHHYWAYARRSGKAGPLDDYSLAAQLARQHKFALAKDDASELARFNYAYHFDAGLFAQYLQGFATIRGVTHVPATISHCQQCPGSGAITALVLADGSLLEGDFFIDCSGFRGLLIEEALHTGYEHWNQWLPCDRALAMPCEHQDQLPPYTRALAATAGWQWRIPLQHRHGNGYVYSSHHLRDEDALTELEQNLQGRPLAAPRVIRFNTGMRRKTWNKNVFAIGLASGFLEPLESTSIYMIQTALNCLFNHFPHRGDCSALSDYANATLGEVTEKLRDFIILHYHLNQREGQAFWDDCRHNTIPNSLAERLQEFDETASLRFRDADFFQMTSWLSMFSGFQQLPRYQHPKVMMFNKDLVVEELAQMRNAISRISGDVSSHQQFLVRSGLLQEQSGGIYLDNQ